MSFYFVTRAEESRGPTAHAQISSGVVVLELPHEVCDRRCWEVPPQCQPGVLVSEVMTAPTRSIDLHSRATSRRTCKSILLHSEPSNGP